MLLSAYIITCEKISLVAEHLCYLGPTVQSDPHEKSVWKIKINGIGAISINACNFEDQKT